jgi:hypothetical protein
MTPLDEGSACHRDLYLTTQTLTESNIHAPGGIPTHDPSKRPVADLRLTARGHWDRLFEILKEGYVKVLSWEVTPRILDEKRELFDTLVGVILQKSGLF